MAALAILCLSGSSIAAMADTSSSRVQATDPAQAAWQNYASTWRKMPATLLASTAPGKIDDSNARNVPVPAPRDLLVNIPLAYFDSRIAGDHLPEFKYSSKKGVVEKVTPAIYDRMLKQWLPRFLEILPFSKGDHIIIGASHGSTDSSSDKHRQNWNLAVIMPIEQRYPDDIGKLSWSFHLYKGNRSKDSARGEEQVVANVDYSFMHDFPSQMKVFVTESGYYIQDFTPAQLHRAEAFWTSLYQALRPGDVFGIHTLINKGSKSNPLALINRNGRLSPVGQAFRQWLKNLDAKPGIQSWSGNNPVAARSMPAARPTSS